MKVISSVFHSLGQPIHCTHSGGDGNLITDIGAFHWAFCCLPCVSVEQEAGTGVHDALNKTIITFF